MLVVGSQIWFVFTVMFYLLCCNEIATNLAVTLQCEIIVWWIIGPVSVRLSVFSSVRPILKLLARGSTCFLGCIFKWHIRGLHQHDVTYILAWDVKADRELLLFVWIASYCINMSHCNISVFRNSRRQMADILKTVKLEISTIVWQISTNFCKLLLTVSLTSRDVNVAYPPLLGTWMLRTHHF